MWWGLLFSMVALAGVVGALLGKLKAAEEEIEKLMVRVASAERADVSLAEIMLSLSEETNRALKAIYDVVGYPES